MNRFKSIWQILPTKYQKQTFSILIYTFLGSILESLGIGLIIPAIALILDENFLVKYSSFINIPLIPKNLTQEELVVYVTTLLLVFYVIKALYLAFLNWKHAQYVFGIKAYLSARLFEKYIKSPYEFYLQQNSSELTRNLTSEIQQFVGNALNPVLIIITELTIVFILITLLFYFQPTVVFFVFASTVIAIFIFQSITKKYLKKWGGYRQLHEAIKIKKIQEGLCGAREIKLLGIENYIIGNHSEHTLKASLVERKQNFLSHLPRLWLELVGVIGLISLVIINFRQSNTSAAIIGSIGLFAAAAFRMLPSANRILNAIQSLRYADNVVALMLKELKENSTNKDSDKNYINFFNQIELKNVSYKYPNTTTNSLTNISLLIKKGESVGLFGKSGAGKSTLLDIMVGLLKPTSGEILLNDHNVKKGKKSWENLVGYVHQNVFLIDNTIRRNIAFGLKDECISEDLLDKAVKAAKLEYFIDSLPSGLDTFIGERGVRLSGGEKQRIGIARALYKNSQFLVLDEATNALDNETEIEILQSIRALDADRTIIIISHRLPIIQYCDRVYKIDNGKLI